MAQHHRRAAYRGSGRRRIEAPWAFVNCFRIHLVLRARTVPSTLRVVGTVRSRIAG